MKSTSSHFAFHLGGHDLEMRTIAQLLHARMEAGDPRIAALHDKGLAWGARASAYKAEIGRARLLGQTPVLIELAADIPLPPGTMLIDHHGARAGEPCALRQVFCLLGLPEIEWTRHFALVAANDTGHVAAMRRMGASADDIVAIRRADRAAQGITLQEEADGQAALARLETVLDGSLLIACLPHNRSATIADPLAIRGEARDLLVLSPQITQFFGVGNRIALLDSAFPGGWSGGELPLRGFWGIARAVATQDVLKALCR